MMQPASRFIQLGCSHDHDRIIITSGFPVHESLGARGFITADHTDGVELVHAFGAGHQRRHGTKRLAAEISIESGYQHTDAAGCEFIGDLNDFTIKELCFIDSNNSCNRVQSCANLGGSGNRDGIVIGSIHLFCR
jgi:hypothetical protein